MDSSAANLALRLGRQAEAVCREYLFNGRREGAYWLVGDTANTRGRSLYVRLRGPASGKGAAGKWTDAATGEHGDLLDLIRLNRSYNALSDAMTEARLFLALPRPEPAKPYPVPRSSPEASKRLYAMGQPIRGSLAEAYLRRRRITADLDALPLRYHPSCYHQPGEDGPRVSGPALLAAVTDSAGTITGVHRTWLDAAGVTKAPLATPRKAMGQLLGNGVRFGRAGDVFAAGEGLETMLSLRTVLPGMPMVAALSSNHLAALLMPVGLRRLYVVRDDDRAGRNAMKRLRAREDLRDVELRELLSIEGDFNDDLRHGGVEALTSTLRGQLVPEDIVRFLGGDAKDLARPQLTCSPQ